MDLSASPLNLHPKCIPEKSITRCRNGWKPDQNAVRKISFRNAAKSWKIDHQPSQRFKILIKNVSKFGNDKKFASEMHSRKIDHRVSRWMKIQLKCASEGLTLKRYTFRKNIISFCIVSKKQNTFHNKKAMIL